MANLFWLSGRAYEDANGNPYPGAKAYFYVTGTTTAQDTYTSASLATPNANPVVADSSTGIFGDIYFAAKRYKCVIKDSSDNTLCTFDPVDASKQRVHSASAPSPTYPGLEWVDTDDNTLYERNVADNGWNNRGDADAAINAASVTEVLAGTATDKAVTPDALAGFWQRGANLTPSGGTVTLPAGGGGVFNVAAGNFSAISSAVGGRPVLFVFSGASTITYNSTSMVLPGSANITTAAGDCALFVNDAATDASGTNWRCVWFQRRSGSSLTFSDLLATQANMETATSTTTIVAPGRVQNHPGVCKGWVNFTIAAATTASHNVTSITDTGTAKWAIVWATDFSSANYCCVTGSEATANNETAVDTLSAGGVNVKMYRSDDTNTAETNSTASHVAAFGDQ